MCWKNRNFQTLIKSLETEDLILGDNEEVISGPSFIPTEDMQKDLKRRLGELEDEKEGLKQAPDIVED